jgi:hypothetical protein
MVANEIVAYSPASAALTLYGITTITWSDSAAAPWGLRAADVVMRRSAYSSQERKTSSWDTGWAWMVTVDLFALRCLRLRGFFEARFIEVFLLRLTEDGRIVRHAREGFVPPGLL